MRYTLYLGNQQHAEALKALVELLALTETAGQPDIYVLIATTHQADNNFAAAFAALEKALELAPGYYKALYQYARLAVLSKQHLDRGIRFLNEYLAKGPFPDYISTDNVYWRLGSLHELKGDHDTARKQYEQALKLNPENEKARKALEELVKRNG